MPLASEAHAKKKKPKQKKPSSTRASTGSVGKKKFASGKKAPPKKKKRNASAMITSESVKKKRKAAGASGGGGSAAAAKKPKKTTTASGKKPKKKRLSAGSAASASRPKKKAGSSSSSSSSASAKKRHSASSVPSSAKKKSAGGKSSGLGSGFSSFFTLPTQIKVETTQIETQPAIIDLSSSSSTTAAGSSSSSKKPSKKRNNGGAKGTSAVASKKSAMRPKSKAVSSSSSVKSRAKSKKPAGTPKAKSSTLKPKKKPSSRRSGSSALTKSSVQSRPRLKKSDSAQPSTAAGKIKKKPRPEEPETPVPSDAKESTTQPRSYRDRKSGRSSGRSRAMTIEEEEADKSAFFSSLYSFYTGGGTKRRGSAGPDQISSVSHHHHSGDADDLSSSSSVSMKRSVSAMSSSGGKSRKASKRSASMMPAERSVMERKREEFATRLEDKNEDEMDEKEMELVLSQETRLIKAISGKVIRTVDSDGSVATSDVTGIKISAKALTEVVSNTRSDIIAPFLAHIAIRVDTCLSPTERLKFIAKCTERVEKSADFRQHVAFVVSCYGCDPNMKIGPIRVNPVITCYSKMIPPEMLGNSGVPVPLASMGHHSGGSGGSRGSGSGGSGFLSWSLASLRESGSAPALISSADVPDLSEVMFMSPSRVEMELNTDSPIDFWERLISDEDMKRSGFEISLGPPLKHSLCDPCRSGNHLMTRVVIRKVLASNARPLLIDVFSTRPLGSSKSKTKKKGGGGSSSSGVSSSSSSSKKKKSSKKRGRSSRDDSDEKDDSSSIETTSVVLSSGIPRERVSHVILKEGDDLRRDACVMAMFTLFNQLWRSEELEFEGIPVSTLVYRCIPIAEEFGLIQLVDGCIPLRHIRALEGSMTQRHLSKLVASAAGSYIASYTMGARDRHFDNILIRKSDCCLFHIDFGFVLGEKVGFDASSFGITEALFDTMKAKYYRLFVELCVEAYLILRRNALRVLEFATLLFTPHLCAARELQTFMRAKLRIGLGERGMDESEDDVRERLTKKLTEAPQSSQTKWKNRIHKMATDRIKT